MWVNLGGSVPNHTIMMETGAGNNGYGVKTTASGGLEFNHVFNSVETRASVSLAGLNLNDYIQIVAVVDATSKQFLLQAKDAYGVSVTSGFTSLVSTGSGTGNQAGLGSAFGIDWRVPTFGGDTGGLDASLSAIANKFYGEIGLFRIYNTGTTTEADLNYMTIQTDGGITTPPEIGMIALEKLSGTNGLSLTWATGSGYNYTVESRSDLVSGSWATNETGIAGTGGDVTVTITPDQAQSFYRVIGQ